MSYIRNETYTQERVRPNLLTNYLANMTNYLKLKHPHVSDSVVEGFVKKIIKDKFKSPDVEFIHHKTEGNSEIVTMALHKFTAEIIADNNLSPSGTCYLPTTKKESFLRVSLEDKIKARNKFKKMYLDFEAQGKKRESQYYNQSQANAKIFNNAIAGGMKIKQFILGCKAGFNAITSTGRISVKQGYSFIERAINGNIYLPDNESAISYILNHSRHVHPDFEVMMKEFNLYVPTTKDIVEYMVSSLWNYVLTPDEQVIGNIVDGLTDLQKSYVFYAGCFKNLCLYNEELMRTWIDSCFTQSDISYDLYKDIDPMEVKSFSDDVLTCILSTNYRYLGESPIEAGKWNSVKDALKYNPDGVRKFVYACRHFKTNFEKMVPVIRPILQIQTTFSKLVSQHKMARYTVPLSDTDSNIFSTQELVRWKRKKLDFSQESYEMNGLLTFLLSQSLEHVFARLSSGLGCEGKDAFRITMKNEFLYPVLIATGLAKHYMAIATMQEGSLLHTPRKDIKGINLRSSAFPKLVRDSFENYVVELFAEIEKGEPIRAASILDHVAGLEKTIYDSVNERESVYLQTISIKREQDYADPSISQYFYYELWKAVFAEDFGEMVVPNKCYKIPLKGGKQFFKNTELLAKLKETYPKTFDKLMQFVELNPKRDITAILIPPFRGKINPFFLDIMDIRAHISQCVVPYYHLLRALGLGSTNTEVNALVSDFYNPTTSLIT
jgi:hypothetical protein